MTAENVKTYESMAKFSLDSDTRTWIADVLSGLEDGFGLLDTINTCGITPLITPLAKTNIMREDVAVKQITRDRLMSTAPAEYDGYFQVPKTIA
ncbi:MAG: Asp-tRNA(Asn)/Glu-tRNA(Gln) amidotransferase subunit GatC [Oscillospiraceae bacterium]|nr:Asp-tRNA(Asn)/Glu-tRNA(Gln) amidotransferase subunit GatC [Oscillospiraceae bacterium]